MFEIKDQILKDREEREKIIKANTEKGFAVLVIRANIPGDDKNIVEAYQLINIFFSIMKENSFSQEYFESNDGPFYLLTFKTISAEQLKSKAVDLENKHQLGRFIDLDVYNINGALSRSIKRKCFFCDDLAVNCIRNRKHSLLETLNYIKQEVSQYFRNQVYKAVNESILLELNLHPKFGMVTPKTNGSHIDMDYNLMLKAKDAIIPVFMEMYDFCKNCHDILQVFPYIRKLGLKAEKAMFKATNGINAYKGLIFNLGLFISAFSYLLYNPFEKNDVYSLIRLMTKDILSDFNEVTDSFGYQAYKKYGILGARGEAFNGFLHIREALNYLKDFSEKSRYETLAYLISNIDDTNLLKRSGSFNKYQSNKELFKQLLKYDEQKMLDLNEYCLANNLSFGGSADLLIVTVFIKKLNIFYKLDEFARN